MSGHLVEIPVSPGTESGDVCRAACPWLEKMLAAKGACKGRILLVEDEPQIRYFYELVLTRSGYFVRTAGDGAECLKKARTMRPDLILLNYLMPVMNGLAALQYLKKDPFISYLRVVMYSAVCPDSPFWEAAMEAGALCCIRTPFNYKTLLAIVEKCMRSL